jgi:propanol-preferring alcohol dehydrogenase
VTAVSRGAFAQARGMVRRGGTVALNGLPPGGFPLPIFSTVLNGITVRGLIVGTRRDLQASLDFAAEGKVRARIHHERFDRINEAFAALRSGSVDGRIALTS